MARLDAPWTLNDLDRKVQIAIPVTSTDDDTGYTNKTFGTETEVYANVIEKSPSKEKELLGGIIYDRIIDVVIRYKSEYESTDVRLRYKNVYYDVVNSREVYGRKRWLLLKCVYGGKEFNR